MSHTPEVEEPSAVPTRMQAERRGDSVTKSVSIDSFAVHTQKRRKGPRPKSTRGPRSRQPPVDEQTSQDLYRTALHCIFVPILDDSGEYSPQKLLRALQGALGLGDAEHDALLASAIPACNFEVGGKGEERAQRQRIS